jgi:hypothetical protein
VTVLAILLVAVLSGPGPGTCDEDTIIHYDSGTHGTWWCSDRDSFGAAVKFTPAEYPCEVIGARAEVGYDDGQQVYLRMFDDNGPGGKPGTVLYEEQRLDIPHGQNIGFRDYDLTAPVRVDSGDFYLCFWQKNIWDLLFGTDDHFDYPARQWWFFPDLGWVTPMGMDAADHLIRAKVRYGTGLEEELPGPAIAALRITPNPTRDGRVRLEAGNRRVEAYSVSDAAGRVVAAGAASEIDLSGQGQGVYLVTVRTDRGRVSAKLVVE